MCIASTIPKPPTAIHKVVQHPQVCGMWFAKQPTAYQLPNHPGCVNLVRFFFQIWMAACLLYIKIECSGLLQTSIYHFQYVHQLGTEEMKVNFRYKPQAKIQLPHTFQTAFSLFFPSVYWAHRSYLCHVTLFLYISLWEETHFHDFSELMWLTQHGWTCHTEFMWLRFQHYALRLKGLVLTFWFCH